MPAPEDNPGTSRSAREALTNHVSDIRQQADSSENAPDRVMRRVVAHLATRNPLPGANEGRYRAREILPTEVWFAVMHRVSEMDELINCFRACTLFQVPEIVESLPGQYFGMILPYVAKYLSNDEILKLRFVSRRWSNGVCTLAESKEGYCPVLRPPQDEPVAEDLSVGNYLHQLTIKDQTISQKISKTLYKFRIPNAHSYDHDPRRQAGMERHQRNPFVGNVAEVSATPLPAGEPSYSTQMQNFLSNFGRYLTSLTLDKFDGVKAEKYKELCSIVVSIFNSCSKLKWFTLKNHTCPPADVNVDSADLELNALPDSSTIRYIKIDIRQLEPILLRLFSKYSNQLYRLYITQVDAEFFSTLAWNNLTEIELDAHLTVNVATALAQLTVPHLRDLHLYFTNQRTTLNSILEGVNSFPRLTDLQITFFGIECGPAPGHTEILGTPVELICRGTITSLVIVLSGNFISYDFLVCFPFLKKLEILADYDTYRDAEETARETTNCDVRERSSKLYKQIRRLFSNDQGEPAPGPSVSNPKKRKEDEDEVEHLFGWIIHLNQFLVKIFAGNDSDEKTVCVYGSNIWEILPYLHTLTVTHNTSYPPMDPQRVFTRQGYRDRRQD